jgi:hypothetical protein
LQEGCHGRTIQPAASPIDFIKVQGAWRTETAVLGS